MIQVYRPTSVQYIHSTLVVCMTKRAASPWFCLAEPHVKKCGQSPKHNVNITNQQIPPRLNKQTKQMNKWTKTTKHYNRNALKKGISIGSRVHVQQRPPKKNGNKKELLFLQYFRQDNTKDINSVNVAEISKLNSLT